MPIPCSQTPSYPVRLLATVRHLSLKQVAVRARRVLRRAVWRLLESPAPQPAGNRCRRFKPFYTGLRDLDGFTDLSPETRPIRLRAADVRKGAFTFLNRRHRFESQKSWHDQNLSQLWRYHLHYFDYCDDLLVDHYLGGGEEDYNAFKELATSWITANTILKGDGWHPYTLSVRVVNWSNAVAGFGDALGNDQEFKALLLSSLRGQVELLYRDLEYDVRGNHLIKNLKALVVASSVFRGRAPQRWYAKAIKVLRIELAEQVLSDGGHFERVPAYHVAVLKDLLECAVWIRRNRNCSYPWLDDGLKRMLDWLIVIAPPGHSLPLIKDTTRDNQDAIRDVLNIAAVYFNTGDYRLSDTFGLYPFLVYGKAGRARFENWRIESPPAASTALKASGFFLMQSADGKDRLLFDAGKTCPDYLPAHAHADMFSYELTSAGRPIVVDSGVYEYAAGGWRDFFRSTRAHNTVELNGCNQSDVWSSFRVGARAYPEAVVWRDKADRALVQAGHNGYLKQPGRATHSRTILWQKERFWLIWDTISGNVRTHAASHIHLHPDIDVLTEGESLWRLDSGAAPLWLTSFGHSGHAECAGQSEPHYQGWYSEKFGEKRPNRVLTLYAEKTGVYHFGYLISRRAPGRVVPNSDTGNNQTATVFHAESEFTFDLSLN